MLDFDWLSECGPVGYYFPGQMIPSFFEVPSDRAMYLVLSGEIDVIVGDKTIRKLTKGDVFGGRDFFYEDDEAMYTASTDTKLYAITERSFEMIARLKPKILLEIFKSAYKDGRVAPAAPVPVVAQRVDTSPDAEEATAASETAAQESVPLSAEDDMAVQNTAAPDTVTPDPESEPESADGQTGFMNFPEGRVIEMTDDSIFPTGHVGYPDITRPEYASLVVAKEYTCPYCKQKFKDFNVLRSRLFQSQDMRYDMRKFYREFSVEWYDFITCPHCCFTTHYTYYSKPKSVLKAAFQEKLTAAQNEVSPDFYGERTLDYVFTSHYLGLVCSAGYIPTGRQLRARIWGNLSWLYEDVGDYEMMRFAADKAADAYESVYMESTLSPAQEQVTCLTIAGMRYRSGKEEGLKKYLFAAKTNKAGDRIYTKMAEDMMDMIRVDSE